MQAELTNPEDTAAVLDLRLGRLVLLHHPRSFYEQPVMLGSVMKLFTAYTLLEAGLGGAHYTCTGHHKDAFGVERACWLRSGHGALGLRGAIANSCNSWFYEMSPKLPPGALLSGFRRFGFGERPARGAADVLPSAVNPRDIPDVAIGDDISMRITPRALLSAVSAIAQRGRRNPLDGRPLQPTQLDPSLLEQLVEGMRAAADEGTLKAVFQGRGVAAKTGTAKRLHQRGTRGLVVGFAPAVKPRYAFLVLKSEGQGARDAGPIALSLLSALAAKPKLQVQAPDR